MRQRAAVGVITVLLAVFLRVARSEEAGAGEHAMHDHAGAAQDPDPMARMETMEPGAGWMTMIHGWAFVGLNRQGGPSGDRDFESQNHVMAMAMRRWAGGKLSLLGMFTIEPLTVPAKGSPLLFQRGESYRGRLLVDRQHPHDLFAQLAVAWERSLSERTRVRLYVAPVGEPAVGPTAFVHRLSASENPAPPLAHHNQDSTHISADVVTGSFTAGLVTVEASAFHGREPDDDRWGIEQGALDSYSGRVWVRPRPGLAIQVSAARRKDPEELEEGDQTRQTASIEYRRVTSGGFLAAALIVGRNLVDVDHGSVPAVRVEDDDVEWGSTIEATWKRGKNALYSRVERVDRDLYELRFKRQRPETVPSRRTQVDAATLGYVRDIRSWKGVDAGVGGDVTTYRFTDRLDDVYGSSPTSFHLFLRLRGARHLGAMGDHEGHEAHTGH